MHGLIQRAAVAAGAAVVLVSLAAGVASARGRPELGHIDWASGGAPTGGSINEANLNGADPRGVLTGQNGPTGVAVRRQPHLLG